MSGPRLLSDGNNGVQHNYCGQTFKNPELCDIVSVADPHLSSCVVRSGLKLQRSITCVHNSEEEPSCTVIVSGPLPIRGSDELYSSLTTQSLVENCFLPLPKDSICR